MHTSISLPQNTVACAAMQTTAQHRVQPEGISYIELSGDPGSMKDWLGVEHANAFPLRWVPGSSGIHAVGIATADGNTLVLKSP